MGMGSSIVRSSVGDICISQDDTGRGAVREHITDYIMMKNND